MAAGEVPSRCRNRGAPGQSLDWLGKEDPNLECGPERCGTESGRPSVASSLMG
jgi:hypothetical protein